MRKFKEGQLVCLKKNIEILDYAERISNRFYRNENIADYVSQNEQIKFIGKKSYRWSKKEIVKKGTTAIVCGYFNILMLTTKSANDKDLKNLNIPKFSLSSYLGGETIIVNNSRKKFLVVLIDGKKVVFESQIYFESSEQTLARKDVNIHLNCVFTIKNVTDKEIIKKQKSLINKLNKISTSCSLTEINEIKKNN